MNGTMNHHSVNVSEIFASNVFNDQVMQQRLPKNTYKLLKNTVEKGMPLEPNIAEIVANAMKDWAIEKGATHYTHWFQPLNGVTAEKHESFISPTGSGRVIMEFSGKELIQGEPDASSFPSGGIRTTFEARGYTAWDATSPAFLKEDTTGVTLYIPTAFYSYTGDALDKKTPLLRSIDSLNRQAIRILRLFGNTTATRVTPSVGPEQEYFLIDQDYYLRRLDLQLTGRTLFGARPPKGHELNDHYFGSIKERVAAFMRELDVELWKLGVSAKTKHNEVAPHQFELAPIYTGCNIATDQNQLVMDTMTKVARHHKLVCLLHPKPFAGVNGSGKHNNWSIATDDGVNLLEPGQTPDENAQFLLFLSAIIRAVDMHADLLRIGAADAGNDHRLGGHEAPPAVISIYLGELLTDILENIEKGQRKGRKENGHITIGITTLPPLPKDSTDRNRTSPFAFTGNKFEFRMVASSASIARPNMFLNTIVADVLQEFADRLEKTDDLHPEIQSIIRETYSAHKRIIFNGDGYSVNWTDEANKRGLPVFKTAIDAYDQLIADKNRVLFKRQNVLTENELVARYNILVELYVKQILIEANTMVSLARHEIMPSVVKTLGNYSDTARKSADVGFSSKSLLEIVKKINEILDAFSDGINRLEQAVKDIESCCSEGINKAKSIRDKLLPAMESLRASGDLLETLTAAEDWSLPTYADMLFKM